MQEQSKSEASISAPAMPINVRICLVGEVAEDKLCCEAARTFNITVMTSETGLELINDYGFHTYFVMKHFETPLFVAIRKTKHNILGPPALQQAAAAKSGLKRNARSIYNYAMDDFLICFTGVRKKDELTKLINLIHYMGGNICKDMNRRTTHLISTHTGGNKWYYAKTFRLTVIKPGWVYAAWKQRDEPGFRANTEEFLNEYKVKAFEEKKICFFGFPPHEHEHMVEVLKSNGGVYVEIDDPECSHVVMPNAYAHFAESISLNKRLQVQDSDDLGQEDDRNVQNNLKRKSENFDAISLRSFPSPSGTKKPKLLRTDSISRSIKRSWNFVAEHTSIGKLLNPRRRLELTDGISNSGQVESTKISDDSVKNTNDQSIDEPVKDSLHRIKKRLSFSSSRKEKTPLNNTNKSPKKYALDGSQVEIEECKTPKSTIEIGRNAPTLSFSKKLLSTSSFENSDILLREADKAEIVVDEDIAHAKHEPKSEQTYILKSDWFWQTMQYGYADEKDYLFSDYLDGIAHTRNTDRHDSLSVVCDDRKGKHFLHSDDMISASKQHHMSDASFLSVSGSLSDRTGNPNKLETEQILAEPESLVCEETVVKKHPTRFNRFIDFYNTESNYVAILDAIVNFLKNPLEECVKDNNALLNKHEIKGIFGNFLPILKVHLSMLERLHAISAKWSEQCLIGDIILQYRDDLIEAYAPYINSFEQMKETLLRCDQQYPRFHEFLKIREKNSVFGRRTLQDLMIRPVQRLPNIRLLLIDILNHTNKNHPDYLRLEKALEMINEVTMHINEDKCKIESRMTISDIFSDIEGCPTDLVSSNRKFISSCEVNELSDNLSGRGDSLILYIFSDAIEICKKRPSSAKYPGSKKAHKHIKLILLNAILSVIDITDSLRAFALLFRHDKGKDVLHSFAIADPEVDKIIYLKALCRQVTEDTDKNTPLLCRTSQELEVNLNDVNLRSLSEAFELATRIRLKVANASSFNKTPSKLKRTTRTTISDSTNSMTPRSGLTQTPLSSCTVIHEVADY
uniref:DH domain-containing protein n=1 Tax=Glossina brevipalpis TaxID=37001 RepID=A0A1A9W9R4_9MUSC